MLEEECGKIATCPVCLEIFTTDLKFTSDDYLFQKNVLAN